MHPVDAGRHNTRHGRYAEAERAYREDLARCPHNGWSLLGLGRALAAQQRGEEAERVRRAFTRADVQPKASCYCHPGAK